jgi:ubiquinone/menaquinone biosynthesis C-methylase UbiE
MSLLDVGCGPGTITAGLAAIVAPGRTLGIDRNPEVLRKAVTNGDASGADNLRFMQADATRLPFADNSFDAVFMHTVLQHLPEPAVAVREAVRVLKPGGVIGLRDADHDSSLVYPEDEAILRSLQVMTELRERRGTSPRVGKRLRHLLSEAGLCDVRGSAVAFCDATPNGTAVAANDILSYWRSEDFLDQVEEAGLATPEEVASYTAAWTDWSTNPGAFWATIWCEAVGRLPEN